MRSGVTRFDDTIREYLPPRNKSGAFASLDAHPGTLPRKAAPPTSGEPLERVAQMHDRRGMFVLLSDLLAPARECWRQRLGMLRARGHEVLVFQILDPRELDFEFENAAQFTDLETGQQHFIDPDAARRDYRDRLNAHLEAAAAICQRSGIDYYLSPTDRPLDLALFDLLTSRSHRAASPARTRANPNRRRAS